MSRYDAGREVRKLLTAEVNTGAGHVLERVARGRETGLPVAIGVAISCPSCGRPVATRGDGGRTRCTDCGAAFLAVVVAGWELADHGLSLTIRWRRSMPQPVRDSMNGAPRQDTQAWAAELLTDLQARLTCGRVSKGLQNDRLPNGEAVRALEKIAASAAST